MKIRKPDDDESKLETGISYLLIIGVVLILVLEISGLVFYYLYNKSLSVSTSPGFYIRGHDFFSFLLQELQGINIGNSAILCMTAGIIVLILTPYLRVVASVIYFGWERNIKFVVITLFVLTVVTLSLALH
jgi:uncharacterized membrane protein